MSWVIKQDAHLELLAQGVDDVEDLGLDRDVERRRRLVGDQQLGLADESHGDDDALAQSPGQLEGVLVEPLGRSRHLDHLEHLEGAALGLLVRGAVVDAQPLADLLADPHGRVQRAHRVLGDQGDGRCPACAHLFSVRVDEVDALEDGCAAAMRPLPGSRRMIARPVVVLPQPDSPDEADALAGVHVERDAVDGRHRAIAHLEADPEVLDREQRRHVEASLPVAFSALLPRRGARSAPRAPTSANCGAVDAEVVPGAGLEPARPEGLGLLRPPRLPIPPSGRAAASYKHRRSDRGDHRHRSSPRRSSSATPVVAADRVHDRRTSLFLRLERRRRRGMGGVPRRDGAGRRRHRGRRAGRDRSDRRRRARGARRRPGGRLDATRSVAHASPPPDRATEPRVHSSPRPASTSGCAAAGARSASTSASRSSTSASRASSGSTTPSDARAEPRRSWPSGRRGCA